MDDAGGATTTYSGEDTTVAARVPDIGRYRICVPNQSMLSLLETNQFIKTSSLGGSIPVLHPTGMSYLFLLY